MVSAMGWRTVTLATVAALGLAGGAAADCSVAGAREFSGEVQKIHSRYLIVDNRMGDKIKFEYDAAQTRVSGEADDWDGIQRNQWATVCSRMLDKPRVAYSVHVEPPKED